MNAFRIAIGWMWVGLIGCSEHGLHGNGLPGDGGQNSDTGTTPDEEPTPEEPEPEPEAEPQTSGIEGRVCDPSGGYWVVGAEASVEWDGDAKTLRCPASQTVTAASVMSLPRTHEVMVTKGSTTLFEVNGPEALVMDEPSCLERDNIILRS